MIEILRKIVQAVNDADGIEDALELIVREVRAAMNTDVCTIYLKDPESGMLMFRATEGLNKDKVGQFGLSSEQGLVGWVATRGEPLNLDDAMSHPSFQLVPGLGEEEFNTFLGAPIIHQRDLLGVLVVQQSDRRKFDDSEEAFLSTVSAQLASVIAHAAVSGALLELDPRKKSKSKSTTAIFGVPGSPGIGMGTGVVVTPTADLSMVPSREAVDRKAELKAFRTALAHVRDDIETVAENLRGELSPEDHALFGVYLGILDDSTLGGEVAALIKQGEWAQGALSQVMLKHIKHFERMEHSYLRERAVDVRDLGTRVLGYLQDEERQDYEYPAKTILVAEEITASALGEIPREKLAGIVSFRGSANCHAAILARAMGVPAVMGASDFPFTRLADKDLVVDGYNGKVLVNPHREVKRRFEQLRNEDLALNAELGELKDQPCLTPDGHHVTLWVNTGIVADVQRGMEHGADGVGLYRTEISFLQRERFPSEEEQRQLYREQLEAFAGQPVTMRTLDIGGDKSLPYFPIAEDNPFLGWRGVRVTLDHPEIFLAQVRAMLKANEGLNNLRILLPMISNLPELREAIALIDRCHDEVLSEGYSAPRPPIGVMIEVPAAVYQARAIAEHCDFLSVGSNDLTQYLLAVDRNNARVADLYHALHPAVLFALQAVAEAGHAAGKTVSICGELAGDPRAAPLLVAMGYDQLSMNAGNLLRVKKVMSAVAKKDAEALLNKLYRYDNAEEITAEIDTLLLDRNLGRYLRIGERANA